MTQQHPEPLVPAEVDLRSTVFHTARVAPEKAVIRPALPLCSLPGLIGTDMTKMSYAQQLKHPFWQRKRLQVLERDGWECQTCGSKEDTLHVHHKRYIKGRQVWEYDLEDLISYCENCHADDHSIRELIDEMIARSTAFDTPRTLAALLGGYLSATYCIDTDLAHRARELSFTSFEAGCFAGLVGLANYQQLVEFVQRLYLNFEGGPLDLDPAAASAIDRWESIARNGFKG